MTREARPEVNLTPAQKVALAGMADPALLCRNDFLDYFSREAGVCWFVWVPQEYQRPVFWSLTPEEGQALVDADLVQGQGVIELSPESTVTTYRITDAGRSLVRLKKLRRKVERRPDSEFLPGQVTASVIGQGGEHGGKRDKRLPGGAGDRPAHSPAGQGTLPFLDPV